MLKDIVTQDTPKNILIKKIKKGFPVTYLKEIKERLKVSQKDIIRVIDISQSTLQRKRLTKKADYFNASESDRIYRLSQVFEKTVALFEGDIEKARYWFTKPKKALDCQSPFNYCDSSLGAQEVEKLIARLEHGITL